MKFTCDRCDAQYMISDEKVGPNGVKVRCKKCSHVILVRRTEDAAANGAAPAPVVASAPSGEGLEAELGQAFDNAFGGGPGEGPGDGASASAPAAPQQDLESTQAVSAEEAARLAARSAPPEPAATEWYVAIGQAQVGPLPLAEVRRKWEAGDIGPDSLVWRPGMGDWAALNGVADLAAYLAPVPRGSARAKPSPTPAPAAARSFGGMPAASPASPAPRTEVSWKPTGASALAALASEELSAQPDARPEPKPVVTARSLMEGLPDGGGVDPTGAIPLQIKALESTGEEPVRSSSVARGAERLRKKRSSTRALVGVIVVLLIALGAGAGYVFKDRLLGPPPAGAEGPQVAQRTPAETPAAAPARPAEPPQPAAAPAPAATGSAATPPPVTAVAQPAPPPPAPPAPPPAEVQPAPATPPPPAPSLASAREDRERTRAEAARKASARQEKRERSQPTRVARAEPEPAPAPRKKPAGGDLLDFDGGNDAALADALGGGGGTGRSVYVPPAPGGGGGLQERVTDSQVNETIMTRVAALQQCLSENKSDQSGVLKMRWSIAPDGGVRSLKCITPENAGTPFATCVTGVLKGLRFPKSQQGRQDVTFPFKF